MKKVLVAAIVFVSFFAFSQKTVQFSDPLPPNYVLVRTVDKELFGSYKNATSGSEYLFDENGVSIVTTIISYVTREQVRESSRIKVRGEYIFGISPEGDSLPVFAEGDKYFYGVRTKKLIVGRGSLHQLTRQDANTYILNFNEGLYFEPSLVKFNGKKLEIIHGGTEWLPEYTPVLVVNNITRYDSPVVVLSPSAELWPRVSRVLFEGEKLLYQKIEE